ncbi:MAG: hypothetical protein DMG97_39275 [Acidobacteria bacterium]|nr:MAG: hypothetical protein DMG97_39275 [Acidobacteriota bacterium]
MRNRRVRGLADVPLMVKVFPESLPDSASVLSAFKQTATDADRMKLDILPLRHPNARHRD